MAPVSPAGRWVPNVHLALRLRSTPTVFLAASAWSAISQQVVQADDGLETGGVLLGHDRAQVAGSRGTGPIVLHAAGPGPEAERREDAFRRDMWHAQEAALGAFAADGSVWIGEWHSHARGDPQPSTTDLRSYLLNLADPVLQLSQFVAIIVTPDTTPSAAAGPWDFPRATAWIVTTSVLVSARLLMVSGWAGGGPPVHEPAVPGQGPDDGDRWRRRPGGGEARAGSGRLTTHDERG
jgi:integrative and conjugative element protein (TIGR02256 family)